MSYITKTYASNKLENFFISKLLFDGKNVLMRDDLKNRSSFLPQILQQKIL